MYHNGSKVSKQNILMFLYRVRGNFHSERNFKTDFYSDWKCQQFAECQIPGGGEGNAIFQAALASLHASPRDNGNLNLLKIPLGSQTAGCYAVVKVFWALII